MPIARVTSSTGPIDLHYEEAGQGFPLIWCHEFGGDSRSWEPQVRYFSRRYRVVTWNYRGFPPSEVPKDTGAYSVEIFVSRARSQSGHRRRRQRHGRPRDLPEERREQRGALRARGPGGHSRRAA